MAILKLIPLQAKINEEMELHAFVHGNYMDKDIDRNKDGFLGYHAQ